MASSPTLLLPAAPYCRDPRRSRIDNGPLTFLVLGLLMSAAPLWDYAPAWTSVLFAFSAGLRLFLNWRKLPLVPLALRLLLLGGASSAILLAYGTFLNVEPGFGVLLVLLSLKILETNSARDFGVLTILGFFLGLCGLFFVQDLGHWIYVGAVVGVLTAATIFLQEGPVRGAFWRSLRLSLNMGVQAFPLVLVLFFFCPRPHGEFRFQLGSSLQGSSGMHEHMEPGSVAGLAMRQERVFRVSFPDGTIPPPNTLYWRGVVLWKCNGLLWDRGSRLSVEPTPSSAGPRAGVVRQVITLEPQGTNWVFALDRPIHAPKNADFVPGGDLRSRKPIVSRQMYEVFSQTQRLEIGLPDDQRRQGLQKPLHVSKAVEALVAKFRSGQATDEVVVARALDYFRKENFSYSLQPGTYETAELDEFLFQRRTGFCEHYAGAFASLMRIAGIPSRVVAGYLGGDYNDIGKYLMVRQSDAHAWCEVWLENTGWVRVDPTSVTAPERINLGLQDYLQQQFPGAGGIATRVPGRQLWGPFMQQASMFYDNLAFQWDLRVLTYNEENQQNFLTLIGLGHWDWAQLTTTSVIAAILMILAVAFYLRQPVRRADAADRAFARFCRASKAAGVTRKPSEGPLEFSERVASAVGGAAAAAIREVGRVYAAIRYGRNPPPVSALQAAVRAVGRLRREPHAGKRDEA